MALREPSPQLGDIALKIHTVAVQDLVRISRHNSGEPFFGRQAANRFDDPARQFGTCYCGLDLTTALAETVLHDEVPMGGKFYVPREEVLTRYAVHFNRSDQQLRLANLTGPSLAVLGADGAISTDAFAVPQRWAAALHEHSAAVDGLLYVSRVVNDRYAVAVFDRAAHKLGEATYAPLKEAVGLDHAQHLLSMVLR
ncbi:MAG: RES family NAD+ phosphorylase [Burkholderiaceae bacterium]